MNLARTACSRKMRTNNTPNASRQLCAPSGVTFFWRKLIGLRIIHLNTPAMPLNDAHFGGFFTSGVCR